jgi:sugar diacid utilization regulator
MRLQETRLRAAMIEAPEIGARLRDNIAALANEPSYLIDYCYAAIMQIDGYANLGMTERRNLRESIGALVARWCRSILERSWHTADEIDALEASVRRRVHQSISLVSVLGAFRACMRELWLAHLGLAEHDAALRDELLFKISPYLLEYSDFMARLIGRTFVDEQFHQTRWCSEGRRQLGELVFNGAHDDEAFRRLGRNLGFDPSSPRIALAVHYNAPEPSNVDPDTALQAMAHAIARHLRMPADHIVYVMRRGRYVMWVPCTCGDSLIFSQRLLSEAVSALACKMDQVGAIGIGFMNQGQQGWAASAEEAMAALDFALQNTDGRKVCLYSDIAIDESVRSNGSALRYFESMIAEILHEKELISTLRCYFGNSQNRKGTAALLGIHPNTLNYRLARIERLLGAKLDEPSWIARLFIALQLRDATGLC